MAGHSNIGRQKGLRVCCRCCSSGRSASEGERCARAAGENARLRETYLIVATVILMTDWWCAPSRRAEGNKMDRQYRKVSVRGRRREGRTNSRVEGRGSRCEVVAKGRLLVVVELGDESVW